MMFVDVVDVTVPPPHAVDREEEEAARLHGWTRNSIDGTNGTVCVVLCGVASTSKEVPTIAVATRADASAAPMPCSENGSKS